RKLTHRIDSLQRLNLPTRQYSHLLDSIEKAGPLKDPKQAEARLASLERKVNEPFTTLNAEFNKMEGRINGELNNLNKEAGGGAGLAGNTNLPTGQAGLPKLQVPGINQGTLPNTNLNLALGTLPNDTSPLNGISGLGNDNLTKDLGKETSELKNLTNSPQKELSQLKNTGDLGKAEKEFGQVNQIERQAKGYSKDVKKVSKGNLDSLTATKTLENKAMQMGPMKPFQAEAGTIHQYKSMAAKGNDPKAMEKLAMEQAQKQAVNHFAGKEKQLQSAMSQISKYKQKYANLSSIKDIPKRARNTMHGKPLFERILPGLILQVQKKSNVLIDFNQQIGYRFNGRLTAGAGWNERVGFHHYIHLTHKDRIYGPRTFAEFKFIKGFALRGDVETMNTFVPPLITGNMPTDPASRQWVWGVFGGIKKEYKLSKSIRGNIQMMYNFHDRFYKTSPYADRLNVRMGFEFPMKKRISP
ncbi:MAG TPA: hypothetical protein VK517_06520, partial [Cyclobacteriaceae bacterium]|nr:hypothetical protein [Cyclobacteriaceae bacterium]